MVHLKYSICCVVWNVIVYVEHQEDFFETFDDKCLVCIYLVEVSIDQRAVIAVRECLESNVVVIDTEGEAAPAGWDSDDTGAPSPTLTSLTTFPRGFNINSGFC